MVVAIDQNGIFVEWNKVAEKVTGWSAAEIIGHPDPSSVLYPDPEYLRELRQRWNENSGQYMNQIWKLRCKDGLWKWISWSNISYDYPVQGWTSWALGTDVTDVIEVTEKLQKKEHNLETIAQVSEVLLSEQNFDLAIQKAFEYLGVSSNADRVYIFENDHNKTTGQWVMNQPARVLPSESTAGTNAGYSISGAPSMPSSASTGRGGRSLYPTPGSIGNPVRPRSGGTSVPAATVG